MKDLKNKTVLITGAANGIGAQLAMDFLEAGAIVIACDIDEKRLAAAYGNNGNCRIRKLDVRSADAWRTVMDDCGDGLDLAINAAGVIRPGYLKDIDTDAVELQIDVNLKGVIYGTKFTAEIMRRHRGGHIINISSMASLAPVSGIGIYTASKFGVRGFSLAMAQELKADGIKVSVVAPDAVDTHMLDDQMNSEAAALTFSGSRILTTKDVSAVILKEVVRGGKTEVWIPMSRGVQAYLGATFPGIAALLTRTLRKKGLKQQEVFRRNRRSS